MSIVHSKFIQPFAFPVILSSEREISNVIPAAGVPVFETDTGKLFIGNGVNSLAELNCIGKQEIATNTEVNEM